MTEKVTSHFNIFECGRNKLCRLDVTYQKAFMATPAETFYYKEMFKSIIKANKEGGKLCNEKLRQAVIDLRAEFSTLFVRQAVIDLRAELNVERKRNINNITCDNLYQSLMKNIDVSTISDSIYNYSDEHVDTIIDSIKQVDARYDPIKETHIVERVSTLSIGVGSLEPAVIGIGIIG